jgi:hypothetical protein
MTGQFQHGISIDAFSERILRSNSVTEELDRWCSEHNIGDGRIVALCARDAPPEVMDEESLHNLSTYKHPGNSRFRRVRLATAGVTVADALNWYFPDNLPSDICHKLETTDLAFGRGISHLNPRRRTFFVRRTEMEQLVDRRGSIDPESIVFETRAVVYRDDNAPLALVQERFRAKLFLSVPGFAPAAKIEVPNDL